MYHGTSDVFLRQILKQGLLAKPPQQSFTGSMDNTNAIPGFEGVYFTNDQAYAKTAARIGATKFGGRPIIVVALITENYGYADEDQLIKPILQKFWTKNLENVPKEQIIQSALKDLNIGKAGRDIYNLIGDLYDKYKNLIKTRPDLDPRQFNLNTAEHEVAVRQITNSPDIRASIQTITQAIRAGNINKKSGSNSDRINLRLPNTLGYSGSSRIIAIYDYYTGAIYYQDPKTALPQEVSSFIEWAKKGLEIRPDLAIPKGHDPTKGNIIDNRSKQGS